MKKILTLLLTALVSNISAFHYNGCIKLSGTSYKCKGGNGEFINVQTPSYTCESETGGTYSCHNETVGSHRLW
ncbi:TPA: hypothetical protein DIC20_05735 [Candidatus Dependentiae bacterium]|nr:MAG: hypothetical protein US03_C0010G0070 [candidate division TM6 bacterium GW2011_GWF2_36_131]KKQ02745.1 MAG: hypothetical protein US13_C0010G0005 [candidate division TM6 bacterium GW2011_GWE2_36_25]KKQ19158.1 MAG: hypothetical protein US32_C0015G0041 [candidate division TM6 bacterium GW2011_GWA2_36_9]HCU01166.1 hypothetical protein [Candidatus Dependentiae bacterium]